MKYLTHLLTAAVAFSTASAAPVDTLFDISGQFNGGGELNGSMMINTQTGALDAGALSISGLTPNLSTFDGAYATVGGIWWANQTGIIDFVQAGTTNYIEFGVPGGSIYSASLFEPAGRGLVGYTGQSIVGAGLEASGFPIADTLASGSIVDPPSGVPEITLNDAGTAITLLFGALMAWVGGRRRD